MAAGLIAAFVIGVMLGTFANGLSAGRPRLVLLCVALLLGIAAIADHVGLGAISVFVAAAAMGAENATFSRDGDVQIGLTYMTGTLVKFAQRLALALQGRKDTGWFSFLLLWVGLVCGGVLGALAGTLGAMQATEVVKEILGVGRSLSGRLVTYDALDGSWDEMAIAKRPDCPTCGHHA